MKAHSFENAPMAIGKMPVLLVFSCFAVTLFAMGVGRKGLFTAGRPERVLTGTGETVILPEKVLN